MAPIEDNSEQLQQHSKLSLPRANNEANDYENDEKVSIETENSMTQIIPQAPKQGSTASDPEWRAGRNEWMVIIVVAFVSLMVALDATILVPVLPVSLAEFDMKRGLVGLMLPGDRERFPRQCNRYLLDWDGLPLDPGGLSTLHSRSFGRLRPPFVLPDLAGLLHDRHSTLLPLPEL